MNHSIRQNLAYLQRIVEMARRNPLEFIDRIAGKVEIRSDRTRPKPTFTASGRWIDELHHLMDWPYPCEICSGFEDVWTRMEATLLVSGLTLGKGYDSGFDLARAAYAATRHMAPEVVIETGVARGVTSRVILEAILENGKGHLYSIDLPPLQADWYAQSAIAVPADGRDAWTLVRGSSRRHLPGLLREHAPIPLFLHDSLHTYKNMSWELRVAWQAMSPGGLILCDDVEDNYAFVDFAVSTSRAWLVAQESGRTGFVGAIRR